MASIDRGLEFREIITKAVCGKGRKFSQDAHQLAPPDSISTILGAWIINHTFEATKVEDAVEITGSYDINIWYAHRDNSKTDVAKHAVSYVDRVPLSYFDRNVRDNTVEVVALETQPPNCIEATITEGQAQMLVRVERDFLVELIGETKLTVAVTERDVDGDDKVFDMDSYGDERGQDFENLDPELVIDDLND